MEEHLLLQIGDTIRIRADARVGCLEDLRGLPLKVKALLGEDYEIDWHGKPDRHQVFLTQDAVDRYVKKLLAAEQPR